MIGLTPRFTSGFGTVSECSRRRVPRPPQNRTTFIKELLRPSVSHFDAVVGRRQRDASRSLAIVTRPSRLSNAKLWILLDNSSAYDKQPSDVCTSSMSCDATHECITASLTPMLWRSFSPPEAPVSPVALCGHR